MLPVLTSDQAIVSSASRSREASVPEAVAVPDTAVRSSRWPASVTEPVVSKPETSTTGASFVPVMVMTTVREPVADAESVAVIV